MIFLEQAVGQGKKKGKRTTIEPMVKSTLERFYTKNIKPNAQELLQMAEELHMEKEVIRVWFCNRRQRDRRQVLVKDKLKGQRMFHPQVGAYPLPQEMPPQGYMPLPPPPRGFLPSINRVTGFHRDAS